MSIEATRDRESVLYDTVTGYAFGPIFGSPEEADDFLEWYNENEDKDIRNLTDEETSQKYDEFAKLPDEYWEVTLIVAGAVEEQKTFYDEGEIDEYVDKIEKEANLHQRTEIHILNHAHRESQEECGCIQYLQDHKPNYVFGSDS